MKHRETCSQCGEECWPEDDGDQFPFKFGWLDKTFVVCSPECAFDLGVQKGGDELWMKRVHNAVAKP